MNDPCDSGADFVERTAAFVRARSLLAPDAPVVVAVSGGADSVALAAALREAGPGRPEIAHVHHGLRRAAADGDAAFVSDLARRWGLPCHVERIDTPALTRAEGVGVEEAARKGRYRALRTVARRAGATAVAVAHHADDQVETVLHRIVRGTHLRGLAGMPARRPLGGGVELVRPLLWARREDVERFCRERRLAWRTDRTNAETDFTRNFIRHELLPLLRDRLNARADDAVLRLAAAAAETAEALDALAADLFRRACRRRGDAEVVLRAPVLRKAHPLLATMALREALARLGAPEGELTRRRFRELLGLLSGSAGGLDLPGRVRAERDGDSLRLARGSEEGIDRPPGGC